ncbi:unnamed protein product [Caretta caretta]
MFLLTRLRVAFNPQTSLKPVWVPSALSDTPQLCAPVADSRSVRQRLVLAEVTRVGDFLDYDCGDWLDPLMLAQRMGLSGPHTPRRMVQEVKAALLPGLPRPSPARGCPLHPRSSGPFHQAPAPGTHLATQPLHREPAARVITSLLSDHARKHLYMLVLHTFHVLTLASHPDTK